MPKNRKAIRSKWIFKTKYDEIGKIARYKARLVALGKTPLPGLHFDKKYSSVVQKKTIRTLFGLAIQKDWIVHHVVILRKKSWKY